MKLIQRREAIKAGDKFYFTGNPCKHGHISKRRTKNRLCVECELTRDHKADYQKRRIKQLTQKKDYHKKNKNLLNKKARDSHQKNKVKRLQAQREYYSKNKGKAFERVALRSKRIKQQTPSWCERDKISTMYTKAIIYNMHVDHIVPLKSDIVCGLHCWHNLQLLDAEANISKGNRHWVDMP